MPLPVRARRCARGVVGLATAAVLAGAALVGTPAASASLRWGPATAPIHPGVTVTVAGVKCLAGFVMTDGTRAFLAIPTSCAGVSDGQPTNGCTAAQVPVGLHVTIQGARYPGRFAYSSYTQMQLRGTTSWNKCSYNALALVRIDPRDVPRTNPSIPAVGGPTGVAWTAPTPPAALTAYVVAPTDAELYKNVGAGWAHQVFPAGAVDKTQVGAPVLTSTGRALGMISLVQQTEAGPVTVTDLGMEIKWLQTVRGFGTVHLARGTRAFSG